MTHVPRGTSVMLCSCIQIPQQSLTKKILFGVHAQVSYIHRYTYIYIPIHILIYIYIYISIYVYILYYIYIYVYVYTGSQHDRCSARNVCHRTVVMMCYAMLCYAMPCHAIYGLTLLHCGIIPLYHLYIYIYT